MTSFDSLLPTKVQEESSRSFDILVCSNSNSPGSCEGYSLPSSLAVDSDHSLQLLHQHLRHIYDENVKLKAAVQGNNVMLQDTLHSVSVFHANLTEKNQAQETSLRELQKLNQKLREENELILAKFEALKRKCPEDLDMLKREDIAAQVELTKLEYMEQLDSVTAKLINSEEQVEQQRIIIKSLNQKIADMQETSESIPILEAQVEVFKIDYANEKSDREILAAKLKDCEELLKHLQEDLLKSDP